MKILKDFVKDNFDKETEKRLILRGYSKKHEDYFYAELVINLEKINDIQSIAYVLFQDATKKILNEMEEVKAFDELEKKLLKEAAKKYFSEIARKDELEECLHNNSIEHIIAELSKNNVYNTAYTIKNLKTGEWRRKLWQYHYFGDSKSKIIVSRTDITKIYKHDKEIQAKLSLALQKANESNLAKTTFLSTVSHDMRTPLNGILGLTDLLLDTVKEKYIKDDLKQIKDSGKYLLNLINDTLDVSKIESGEISLRPSVCVARDMLTYVVNLIQPNLKKKEIKLNLDVESLPYTLIYVDIGRVEQVFMNILSNAIKFSSVGSNIDVTVRHYWNENNILTEKIFIKDYGIGMSDEFQRHIFEPFAQEHQNTTTEYRGTGLGMTITKQIIDIMKGEISIDSKLGVGTEFTFTLPLPIATLEQIEKEKVHNLNHSNQIQLEGKRILVCEDHPLNMTIFKRLLKNVGVEYEVAVNGQEGVDKFLASSKCYFDAILMDIRMPIMDGITATVIIRNSQHEDAKTIPIIAITANAFDSDIEESLAAGMNAHVAKPVIPETLYKTITQEINKLNFNKFYGKKLKVKKSKVLIVDDAEINLAVLKETLNNEYEVLEAMNGKEALEILDSCSDIIAVVTDIYMPEMNGLELISEIRKHQKYKYLAIIANTQYGDIEQEEELLMIGADDFVYKPMKSAVILARLKNVLRKYEH